jgi:hypothetical protein
VHAIGVREFNRGLRWEVEARQDGKVTMITCDTTRDGTVTDLQSETHVGTTGDATLDVEVHQYITDLIAQHTVLQQLEAINGKRWGRSDRLRFAA